MYYGYKGATIAQRGDLGRLSSQSTHENEQCHGEIQTTEDSDTGVHNITPEQIVDAGEWGDRLERLIGSLQVDISHTREQLQWRPKTSVDDGLREAVHPA